MIVKKSKQLGNFKRGINLYVPKRKSFRGIIVATTNAIILSGLTGGYYSLLNGTYTKSTDPANVYSGGVEYQATGAVYFNSAYTGGNKDGAAIFFGPNFYGGGGVGWWIGWYDDNTSALAVVVSADSTTVPTGGYSFIPLEVTGTITLTAA